MRRFESGVEWEAKNYWILKIHPDGSEPSKRGTSSFILCGLLVFAGEGLAEEEEGEWVLVLVCSRLATRRSRSSSFSVTWI